MPSKELPVVDKEIAKAVIDFDGAVVRSVHNVWSNGTVVRRYQGQDKMWTNKDASKGYKKMRVIVVDCLEEA